MAIPLRDNHTEEGTGEIVIDELVERPNRNQKKKGLYLSALGIRRWPQ